MIYLKAAFVGIVLLVAATLILMVFLIGWVSITTHEQVGFDVVSLVRQPVIWVWIVVLFGLGFGWELRRLVR
jgi:hypothetical protein